jgi:hypothetical protein
MLGKVRSMFPSDENNAIAYRYFKQAVGLHSNSREEVWWLQSTKKYIVRHEERLRILEAERLRREKGNGPDKRSL